MKRGSLGFIISFLAGLLVIGLISWLVRDRSRSLPAALNTEESMAPEVLFAKPSASAVPPVSQPVLIQPSPGGVPHAQVPTPGLSELEISFAQQLRSVKEALPTVSLMKKKTLAEVHDTPQEVLNAGMMLGRLKESWKQHAELRPRARDFYRECALSLTIETSVRALCLVNLRILSQELGLRATHEADERSISQSIKNIADQIPH